MKKVWAVLEIVQEVWDYGEDNQSFLVLELMKVFATEEAARKYKSKDPEIYLIREMEVEE